MNADIPIVTQRFYIDIINFVKRFFASVAYIVIMDRKLLLVRSKGKKAFYMPGGKLEAGETDAQALAREVAEEISLTLDQATLSLFGVFTAAAYGEGEGVTVELRVYSGEHSGDVRIGSEIEASAYFTRDEYFRMPETAPAVRLLFNALRKRGVVE